MSAQHADVANYHLQYAFDLSQSRFFTKDENNYANLLGAEQLPVIGKTSMIDVFLSAGNVVEPHYHWNSTEIIYCISGEIIASMINPVTKQLTNIRIQPQQVVVIPQGWWHYFAAAVDHTHVLTIYDAPMPETAWGSDILRLTPPQVFSYSYCLNKEQLQHVLAPIQETVIIGPPADCYGSGYYAANASAQQYY